MLRITPLLFGLAGLVAGAHAEVIDVDNAQLAKLMASGIPVVDIRTAPEWKETGVIPGSRLLTFFDEQGRSDAAAWLAKLKPIAPADQPLIIICRSGNRTQAVSRFLSQQAGYRTVYNVRSGIRAWIQEGGKVAAAGSRCEPPRVC